MILSLSILLTACAGCSRNHDSVNSIQETNESEGSEWILKPLDDGKEGTPILQDGEWIVSDEETEGQGALPELEDQSSSAVSEDPGNDLPVLTE